MNLLTLLMTAIRAIWRNRVRSFLTMLGVIIGVMSVILLLAIGSGIQKYITNQFDSLGANSVIVAPGQVFGEGGGFSGGGGGGQLRTSKLSSADAREIKRLRELVVDVASTYTNTASVTFRSKTEKGAQIYGVTESYRRVRNTNTVSGRFFSSTEEDAKARVVVLGPKMAEKLFGTIDPINKKINIDSTGFTVIGIAESKGGSFGGPSFDDFIYMPITSAHQLFNSEVIQGFAVQVISGDKIDEAISIIKKTLLKRLKDDEFSVFDQRQLLDTINGILSIITSGLGGIAAISLLVGGIGIMNIMLVSVSERTREIGLRKAIGATPYVILLQFLIESSMLSILGGAIGVTLSFGITLIMNNFFPAQVTLWSVTLAFIVSAATGIIFGVLPARKAASLSPIEALRYE